MNVDSSGAWREGPETNSCIFHFQMMLHLAGSELVAPSFCQSGLSSHKGTWNNSFCSLRNGISLYEKKNLERLDSYTLVLRKLLMCWQELGHYSSPASSVLRTFKITTAQKVHPSELHFWICK